MARSVYVPSDASVVAYAALPANDDVVFDDLIDDARSTLNGRYPSVTEDHAFWGMEGVIFASNRLALFGVSEYCGLVAIWVVSRGSPLDDNWASKVSLDEAAACFGDVLVKRGTFSNGEAIFACKNGPNKGPMRLAYSSEEGRL